MLRPILAALRVAPLLLLAQLAVAGGPNPLEQARRLLERDEARAAAEVLEAALPTAASDRPALLQLLRRAYESAARQAEAAGKPRDAEQWRDNLAILNRKPKSKEAPTTDEALKRASAEALKQAGASESPASAEIKPEKIEAPIPLPAEKPAERVESPPSSAPPSATASTASPAPKPAAGPKPIDIAEADAAFLAKKYDEAGRIYTALDRERRLPSQRRNHWAYCRWVELVHRINANPTTAKEWASINADIRDVCERSPRSPNNWYGDYLRDLAAERSRGVRRPASDQVILRGSAPEEHPADKPGAIKASRPRTVPGSPGSPPAPARDAGGSDDHASLTIDDWQVRESTNFRIYHRDPALAGRVASAAESARAEQSKRWAGAVPRGAWSPRCDLYLYPSAKTFSRMTGQPEDSPGFSTMGLNAGRIVARRINLRADHPNLLAAILPHEITHVILADLFPTQQVPRWADEGMAVLAEPGSEQRARATDLGEPLAANRLFKLNDLMVMDYPDGKHWGLYYAQSVSLTRFLVDLEGPGRFIDFVQASQRNGIEAELRRVYRIDGFADLQARWLAFAKNESATMTAVAPETPNGGSPRTR